MINSPPPSPASILKAQLIVEKAKLANSKVKKAKTQKNSPTLAQPKNLKVGPARSWAKKAVNKGRVEDGQGDSDKENADSSDRIKYILLPVSQTNLTTIYLVAVGSEILMTHLSFSS